MPLHVKQAKDWGDLQILSIRVPPDLGTALVVWLLGIGSVEADSNLKHTGV